MREKLRIRQAVVVEGKYDAAKLADIVDAPIITTGGFGIYRNKDLQALLKQLGRSCGLILLTDSDAAGFRIRSFITGLVGEACVAQAYIPAVEGKEKRKAQPSREGTLGVEGLPAEVICRALLAAGAAEKPARSGRAITYTDLYEWGLSGGEGSAGARRRLLARIGLPPRLSKKALCAVLNEMYTYEECCRMLTEKPVLFWDFHGTLAEHDPVWYTAAMRAVEETPGAPRLEYERVREEFHASALPWWNPPAGEERRLRTAAEWWTMFCGEMAGAFVRCGCEEATADRLAEKVREIVCRPEWHRLKADAVSTLAELQKRGYRQFLLSNNFPETAKVAEELGLAPYFEGMIVSACVGYDKPQQGIFRLAWEQAGRPACACMIGDNATDDIRGAKKAGWMALGVGRAARCRDADGGSETLQGLLELLR